MQSLKNFDQSVPKELLSAVVAHRGFHDPSDSLNRPIENTLNAFVSVWSASHTLSMCECDVTTTRDGVVVVAHDSNFNRLAKAKTQLSNASVETKTFSELSGLELKDGSRVLPLKELLVNLQKYPKGRLIIEIKETVNVDALVAFFLENSQLLKQVPVIMSFERYICFKVKSALQEKANVMLLVEMTNGSERRQQLKFKDPTMSISSFDLRTSASSDIIQEVFLKQNGVALDGIYFQYQHEMMSDHLIHNTLQYLSTKVQTGVFLAGDDRKADKISTLKQLHNLGVKYINSDIPEGDLFFRE